MFTLSSLRNVWRSIPVIKAALGGRRRRGGRRAELAAGVERLETRMLLAAVVVGNNTDAVNGTVTSIAALISTPGSDGISLREAILAANNTVGADTITFNASANGTIFVPGELTITETVSITGNGALNTILDAAGTSRIFQITNSGGDVTLEKMTLQNGFASTPGSNGGAVEFQSFGGTLRVNQCAFDNNFATNFGGAIFSNNGLVAVSESTLSLNTALSQGGAIWAEAGLTVSQSTISGNSANFGGGIYVFGGLTVDLSTITGNTITGTGEGGGIYISVNGLNTIKNSIVAGNNPGPTMARDIRQLNFPLSVQNSLIGDNLGTLLIQAQTADSNGNFIGDSQNGMIINLQLAALANNGGPTQTHALLAGSLALNSGSNSLVPSLFAFDQRLAGFPRIVSGIVDMGAFEFQLNLDPNDQISEATPMLIQSCTPNDIGLNPLDQLGGNDVDMYSFTATAGQTLYFDVDHTAPLTLNSYLRLFNAAGTQLAFNNNAVGGGVENSATEAYVLWTFPTAGTYYVGVSAASNSGYNALTGNGDAGGTTTGTYTLQIGEAFVRDDGGPGPGLYAFSGGGTPVWAPVGGGWLGDTQMTTGLLSANRSATILFSLVPGAQYRVSATYRVTTMNTTGAMYQLNSTPQAPLNQAVPPNDFTYQGGNFETVGVVTTPLAGIGAGLVNVGLTNQSTAANVGKRVFADGFIVERLDCITPPPPPEALVCDVSTPVADDTGLVDFGTSNPNVNVYKTFTVKNTGTTNLTVQPVTVTGTGYVIQTNMAANTVILPGGTATFTLCFSGPTVGTYTGTVSFATDDPNSNPYNFALTAEVIAVPVVLVCDVTTPIADDTGLVDWGFTDTCVNTYKVITVKNTGAANLIVQPVTVTGTGYSVSSNFAANTVIAPGGSATFTVCFTGTTNGTFAGTVSFATNDPNIALYNFALSAKIDVRYLDNGPVNTPPAGFTATNVNPNGPWFGSSGGRCANIRFALGQLAPSTPSFASWQFSGLIPGTDYKIWASWRNGNSTVINNNATTTANYTVNDGSIGGPTWASATLNQQVNGNDLIDLCDPGCTVPGGSYWETIGIMTVTSTGTIVVQLSNQVNVLSPGFNRVFADSIRIACVN